MNKSLYTKNGSKQRQSVDLNIVVGVFYGVLWIYIAIIIIYFAFISMASWINFCQKHRIYVNTDLPLNGS